MNCPKGWSPPAVNGRPNGVASERESRREDRACGWSAIGTGSVGADASTGERWSAAGPGALMQLQALAGNRAVSALLVQRVHLEGGRRVFDSAKFKGDAKLEACLNDEDRVRPNDTGPSVIKIQEGLRRDGADLGEDGTSGVYGATTGQAVMAFKRKHGLGSNQFPDVGPRTSAKLDELASRKTVECPPCEEGGERPQGCPPCDPSSGQPDARRADRAAQAAQVGVRVLCPVPDQE